MAAPDSRTNLVAIYGWLFIDWVAQGMFMGAQIGLAQRMGPSFGKICGPVYALGIVMGMPVMGKLSDSKGRKAGLAADSFVGTMIPSFMQTCCIASDLGMGPLLALSWLWGAAGCATSVVAASLGDTLPQAKRAKYTGYALADMFWGMAVGFSISGSLTDQAHCSLIAGILSGLSGLWMLGFVVETNPFKEESATTENTEYMPASEIITNGSMLTMFFVTWCQFFTYSMFESASTLAVKDVWGQDGASFPIFGGILGAIFALTVLGPLVEALGIRQGLALGHGLRMFGFFLFAICWRGPRCIPSVSWAAVMIGIQLIDATANAFITMLVPQKARGTAIGLNKSCGGFGRMLGPYSALTLYAADYALIPFYLAGFISIAAITAVLYGLKGAEDSVKARELSQPFLEYCMEGRKDTAVERSI